MLLQDYNGCVSRLPAELQNTTSGVLFSCVLSVITNNKPQFPVEGNEADNEGGESPKLPKDDFDLSPASHIQASDGQLIDIEEGNGGIFQSLFAEDKSDRIFAGQRQVVNRNGEEIYLSESDNPFMVRVTKGLVSVKNEQTSQVALQNFVQNLIKFEQQAIIRRQVMRLMEDQTLPLKPAMSAVERGIKETELLSFSSYSTADLYRSNQLQEMEEMLQKYTKTIANFTGHLKLSGGGDGDRSVLKRKYFRYLPSLTFAQAISKEIEKEPIIVKRYYPLTDDLLYALHWPPPDRRMKQNKWRPTKIFKESIITAWQQMKEDSMTEEEKEQREKSKAIAKKLAKKKKKTEEPAEVKVEEKPKVSFDQDTTTLTPAGNAIAQIKKMKSTADVWLSVHISGSVVGIRVEIPPGGSGSSPSDADGVNTARTDASSRPGTAGTTDTTSRPGTAESTASVGDALDTGVTAEGDEGDTLSLPGDSAANSAVHSTVTTARIQAEEEEVCVVMHRHTIHTIHAIRHFTYTCYNRFPWSL